MTDITNEDLAPLLAQEDPEFRAFVEQFDPKCWARYDLSAMRIGYHYGREPLLARIAGLEAQIKAAQEQEPVASDAYDMIDRFLRNNLDDDDYAEYSAALDALYTAPVSVPQWQPIETAPKDGSSVILRSCDAPPQIADGYWSQGAYNGAGAWIWPYIHANPSEWMPLPPHQPRRSCDAQQTRNRRADVPSYRQNRRP